MGRQRDSFKLGLAVTLSLVLFVVGVMYIGGQSFDETEPIVVRIGHDQDVPRIKPGAPIICGPQQVGSIQRVMLLEAPSREEGGPENFLYFELVGEVRTAVGLREDCSITVSGSLLGDTGQLRIVNRGTAERRATDGGPLYAEVAGFAAQFSSISREFDADDPDSLLSQIKSQLDPSMADSLIAKIHVSLDDVNAMTEDLKDTVDPDRKAALIHKIDSILTNVNAVTGAMRAQLQAGDDGSILAKVHRGLDQVDLALMGVVAIIDENRADVRTTVEGVTHMVDTLDQSVVPAIVDEFDPTRAKSLLKKAHEAADGINRALADLNVASDKVRRVAVLGADRAVTIVDNAKEASEHLKAVAKDLRRQPWRLIHKPSETESRQAYILDAVREFTEASAHLDDLTERLAAMVEANGGETPVNDPAFAAVRGELEQSLARFSQVEQALWKLLDIE